VPKVSFGAPAPLPIFATPGAPGAPGPLCFGASSSPTAAGCGFPSSVCVALARTSPRRAHTRRTCAFLNTEPPARHWREPAVPHTCGAALAVRALSSLHLSCNARLTAGKQQVQRSVPWPYQACGCHAGERGTERAAGVVSGAGGSKVCRAQGQLKLAWLLWAKSVPHRNSGLATHLYLIEMYPGLH